MTDTVYLHYHGPDLARAAALVEDHLRALLGDRGPSAAKAAGFPGVRPVRRTVEPTSDEEGVTTA